MIDKEHKQIGIGIDMGVNIGIYMRVDIGIYVGVDIGIDMGIDIGIDMGIDMGIDIGIDMGIDMGIDIGIDIEIDTAIDIGINVNSSLSNSFTRNLISRQLSPTICRHTWQRMQVLDLLQLRLCCTPRCFLPSNLLPIER